MTPRRFLLAGLLVSAVSVAPRTGVAQQALQPIPPAVRGVLPADVTQCRVSFKNRVGTSGNEGTPVVLNVPVTEVPTRVRATCLRNGQVVSGVSEAFAPVSGGISEVTTFDFGDPAQVARIVAICTNTQATNCPSTINLQGLGSTRQLTVGAEFTDGSSRDVTANAFGGRSTTNPEVATVSNTGLLTAVGPGTTLITARVAGKTALAFVRVTRANFNTLILQPDPTVLEINQVFTPQPTQQMSVIAIAGEADRFDVTSTAFGTTYEVPDPSVQVSPSGLLSGAADVSGTLTVRNSGQSDSVALRVRAFSPTPVVSYGRPFSGFDVNDNQTASTGDLIIVNQECNGFSIYEPLNRGFLRDQVESTCIRALDAVGDTLAVAHSDGEGFVEGVTFWDISTPTTLTDGGDAFIAFPANYLDMSGDRVYVAQGNTIGVIDATDLRMPMEVGRFTDMTRFFTGIAGDASSGIVVAAAGADLLVFDTNLAPPWTPAVIANAMPSVADEGEETNIKVVGRTVYVVYGQRMPTQGVGIKYDVTNAAMPVEVNRRTYTTIFPRGLDVVQRGGETFLVVADYARANSAVFLDSDLVELYDLRFDTYFFSSAPGAPNPQSRGVVCNQNANGFHVSVGSNFLAMDVGDDGVQIARLSRGTSTIDITTNTLPFIEAGVDVDEQFMATGGVGTLTWRVRGRTNETIVPGVTLSSTGRLFGLTTAAQSQDFEVVVTDSQGNSDVKSFTLNDSGGLGNFNCQ